MPDKAMMRELFDRWECVWHKGQYDLISACVGSHYIRHDEQGDRTVTREAYAAELAAIRQERAGIRVVVYDHSFTDDRAGFVFRSSGLIRKLVSPAVEQGYRATGSKTASWWKFGLPCSH